MKGLQEIKWAAYFLEDICTISSGVRLTTADQIEGNRPFIGASDSNNGVTAFVGNTNASLDYDVLGVNYNGSVVENFYHPYEAIFSDDVKRLHLRDVRDNKYIFLFLKSAILKQKVKFEYGYKFNGGRMKRTRIMLPTTENGVPDYAYMEAYMKAVEVRLLKRYKDYLSSKIFTTKIGGGKSLIIKWKAFDMEEIFDIQSGHDIYQRERTIGETPYITSTAEQNGIGYFVGNTNETLESNCISVNRNGSIGYAFYHPYKALYGNDTRKLIPHVQNKFVCIFLTQTIISQKDKYGYGLKMGTARLRRQKIMLPVNESGTPDYSFMESYMKAVESKLLLKYIEQKLS